MADQEDTQQEPQGLVFPCEFPLKMFGKNEAAFIAAVDQVIVEHVPKEEWASSKTNLSKNDKYLGYTVVVVVQNREQLDRVCAAVKNCPAVIMSM